jgi:hypothetical protein
MSPAQQNELNYIERLREFIVVLLPFGALFAVALIARRL